VTVAVSFYSSVTAIHVMAVVLAFGWFAVHPLLLSAVSRATEAGAAAVHRTNAAVGPRLVSSIGAVALLAGIYLAIDGPWEGSEPWIAASLVILLVLLALGGISGPRERRLAELAEAGRGPAYEAQLRTQRALSSAGLLLLLVAVFLMVTKPG
jgi:uncharacterized membrane protein